MLSEDILIVDIDEDHWRRLLERTRRPMSHRTRHSILLLVVDGDRVVKAIHNHRGTLRGFKSLVLSNLEALAAREKVDVVWAIERGALPDLFRRADSRWDPTSDYFDNLLQLARGFGELYGSRIRRHPPLSLPAVAPERIAQAIEWAVPDERTFLVYVFDGPAEVHTSLILRKRRGHFDLLTTHETLVVEGFAFTDWRRDVDRVLAAIEAKWGVPFVGAFLDRQTLDRVQGARRPFQELIDATRDERAIVSPYPVRLKMLASILRWLG